MPTLATVLDIGNATDLALVVPGGPEFTYARLREEVGRAADTLASLGIGREDRVAIVLPNGAEAVVLFLAATLVATAAPLNPNYTEEEFRFYMEDTGARALIVPKDGAAAARAAVPPETIVIESSVAPTGRIDLRTRAPLRAGTSASQPDEDDVALVLHTSGTTSRPKRVPLRHRNLSASVDHIAESYALGPADVSLCVMPLFHVHGLMASTLACLRSGGRLVVPERFNALGFVNLLREQGITWYSAVPTIHQLAVARLRGDEPVTGTQLRFIRSCSSALSPALMEQLEARFDVPVLEAYGMTEASHQIASNPLPPAPRLPGSVGVGTGVEVGIMDDAGNLLREGAAGEVVIWGPNVTSGYENNPTANAESFTNGWFRTGDLGMMRQEPGVHSGGNEEAMRRQLPTGPVARLPNRPVAQLPGCSTHPSPPYVTLLGRIKELINRGGEKISPREIDEVLLLHPAVSEAVCFGMPHAVWGEEVGAAVALTSIVDEAELIRFCKDRIADFKTPRKIFVLESIPRTATGKVQRRHVAAAVLDKS